MFAAAIQLNCMLQDITSLQLLVVQFCDVEQARRPLLQGDQ